MKHVGVRWLVGILVLLVVVAGIGGGVVWLKIAALKNRLADDLGRALQAQVQVASLSFDWWKGEIHAAGITLTNQRPDAPWDEGEISQATIHFHLRDLLAPTLPLSLEVSSWKLVLHPYREAGGATASSSASDATISSGEPGSHRAVQVTELSAQEGEVEIDLAQGRQVLIHDVAFDATSTGSVWTTQVQASSISAGSMELGASSVQLRGAPGRIAFSELRLPCAQGMITGDGDVALDGSHQAQVNLKAVEVPVAMLVAVQWQMKLSGLVTGTMTYHGGDQGAEAQGQISIGAGKFNVLPFLGKMAVLIGLPDITDVEVDKATTDFSWKDGVLHLTNIDIRKTDVTRVAGEVDVAADSQIDGRLKLGLPETVLARWPQLQTAVFPVTLEDYGWADLHLTGTPDHLQEDLSSRVLATGIQSGSGLINQGGQKAMDLLKNFLGQ